MSAARRRLILEQGAIGIEQESDQVDVGAQVYAHDAGQVGGGLNATALALHCAAHHVEQEIGREGAPCLRPDLHFDGVLWIAQKAAQWEVLLHAAEEQFDVPPPLVDVVAAQHVLLVMKANSLPVLWSM